MVVVVEEAVQAGVVVESGGLVVIAEVVLLVEEGVVGVMPVRAARALISLGVVMEKVLAGAAVAGVVVVVVEVVLAMGRPNFRHERTTTSPSGSLRSGSQEVGMVVAEVHVVVVEVGLAGVVGVA